MRSLESLQNRLPTQGIFDLSDLGTITITGEKAKQFLQGQVTCNLEEVTPTQSRLAAYCNIKGRVIGFFRIIECDSHYLLIMDKDIIEIVAKTLRKYAVFSGVTVEIASPFSQSIGILDKNPAFTEFTFPEELDQVISTESYTAYRMPGTLPRWVLLVRTNVTPILAALFQNRENWDALNILTGFPTLTQSTSAQFTPHRLGLIRLNAVSFKKGCYLGQEIVARTQYLGQAKGGLYWAEIDSAQQYPPNTPLFDSQQQIIGHIMNSVLIDGNSTLILAVLNQSAAPSDILFRHEFL